MHQSKMRFPQEETPPTGNAFLYFSIYISGIGRLCVGNPFVIFVDHIISLCNILTYDRRYAHNL